jgi:hypothetical protein
MPEIVHCDLEIKDGAWDYEVYGKEFRHGKIRRIGNLPRGMKSGAPSFALLAEMDDGSVALVETSWKAMSLAVVGLIARWGTP